MSDIKLINLTPEEYMALKQNIREEVIREMTKETLDVTLTQPVRPILMDTPKPPRIDVVTPTYLSRMEENTSTYSAMDKAMERIREQANKLQ